MTRIKESTVPTRTQTQIQTPKHTNRRQFLSAAFALVGLAGVTGGLAGCGGGKSSGTTGGGGAAVPQRNAAVRAIAVAAHQSISGGRFYAFAAVKLAAPAGSQFSSRAAGAAHRSVPDSIVYDDGLQLYKKYSSSGGTVSVSYYKDAAGTIPAGSATVTEVGFGDFTNSYTAFPATVRFSADTTDGTVPFTGSGSITYLDASGANTLTGSFTSRRNNVTLAGTLNLSGAGDVTGGMTMTQGGVTTRVSGITGQLSGDLVGNVASDPYGWTGTIRFSLATGIFTLTLNTGTGTNGGTATAHLDDSGNLVIGFADGTTQTIINPLSEFIDRPSPSPTPTPTAMPSASPTPPSNALYQAIILDPVDPRALNTGIAYGVSGNRQVGNSYGSLTGGANHALLWSGSPASYIDLHPAGFAASAAYGISGNSQVGYGKLIGGTTHALLWNGSAAGAVDLNFPAGFTESQATSVSGNTQAGYGTAAGGLSHALLWSGTAASYVDLHPAGFDTSVASGVSGNTQVGYGRLTGGDIHALLWSGSAASVVDLNPPASRQSQASGVSGDGSTQVGYGIIEESTHALLWHGTAESVVDLNTPAGFYATFATGVSGDGNTQVGYGFGTTTGAARAHALLWNGTAASAVDLHPYLTGLSYFPGSPIDFTDSQAQGIDLSTGNIVGYGSDNNGYHYAILWKRTTP